MTIVSRCSEDHIRHINPFMSSTVWLATAVQLVRKYCGPGVPSPGLIQSRFYVLYMTYNRCAKFWDSKTAMGQNLEMLEGQLEAHYNTQQVEQPPVSREPHGEPGDKSLATPSTNEKPTSSTPGNIRGSVREGTFQYRRQVTPDPSENPGTNHNESAESAGHTQYLPWSPQSNTVADTSATKQHPAADVLSQPIQPSVNNSFPLQPAQLPHAHTSMERPARLNGALHFMESPSHPDRNYILGPDSFGDPLSSAMEPSLFDLSISRAVDMDSSYENNLGWRDIDLPVTIQDILSGMTTF